MKAALCCCVLLLLPLLRLLMRVLLVLLLLVLLLRIIAAIAAAAATYCCSVVSLVSWCLAMIRVRRCCCSLFPFPFFGRREDVQARLQIRCDSSSRSRRRRSSVRRVPTTRNARTCEKTIRTRAPLWMWIRRRGGA